MAERVTLLRGLATRVAFGTLALAEALFVEHTQGLWQRARSADGQVYASEEDFWEAAVGIKRRSAYQLVAIGRMLHTLALPEADRTALADVGLHKLDTLVPVLEQAETPEVVRSWTEIARTHPPRRPARESAGGLGAVDTVIG